MFLVVHICAFAFMGVNEIHETFKCKRRAQILSLFSLDKFHTYLMGLELTTSTSPCS